MHSLSLQAMIVAPLEDARNQAPFHSTIIVPRYLDATHSTLSPRYAANHLHIFPTTTVIKKTIPLYILILQLHALYNIPKPLILLSQLVLIANHNALRIHPSNMSFRVFLMKPRPIPLDA